jgi:superfamily II DNA or RNA helicase
MELRDYQQTAIDSVRTEIISGHKPVLSAPTGSGKTLIASEIFALAREKNKRVVFVVPFLSLINQTWRAFERAGMDARDMSIIQGDHQLTNYSKPIQIASAQTLERRPKLPEADMVIFDECHINRKIYQRWMNEAPHITFIGLSATPWANGMGDLWSKMIVVSTLAELIEQKHLSPFKYYAPAQPDLSKARVRMGDYVESDLEKIMVDATLIADIVNTWREKANGRPTFCFCVNRKHAQEVQAQFLRAGIPAGYVDAYTKVEERENLVAQLKTGHLSVICNIGTMTTGVDAPFVSCIIMARPTKSEMLFIQIVGRGLRQDPESGKTDCLILDHSNTALNLGRPDEIHYDGFASAKAATAAEKRKQEKNKKKPRLCPCCQFVLLPKESDCPSCGYQFPPPVSNVAVHEGALAELGRKGKVGKYERDDKQAWYSGLLWIAKDRGYNKGWVAHKYKEAFGVWPKGLDERPEFPDATIFNWVKSRNIAWAKVQNKIRQSGGLNG